MLSEVRGESHNARPRDRQSRYLQKTHEAVKPNNTSQDCILCSTCKCSSFVPYTKPDIVRRTRVHCAYCIAPSAPNDQAYTLVSSYGLATLLQKKTSLIPNYFYDNDISGYAQERCIFPGRNSCSSMNLSEFEKAMKNRQTFFGFFQLLRWLIQINIKLPT